MNRWKTTMSTAAGTVSHGHGENSSTSGAMISTVVPATWAITWATRDGRRSLGKSRKCASLRNLKGSDGLLLPIGGTTLEKSLPNFHTPVPTHTTTVNALSGEI